MGDAKLPPAKSLALMHMMTFDIPHMPGHDGSFLLSINESEPLHFPSRLEALNYANRLARQREQMGLDYAINVEGGDGKWRLFHSQSRINN